MQDKPTASELLEAVAAFITEEALPALDGAQRFHALVAANVARIVAREKVLGPELLAEECTRLWVLLGRQGTPPAGADRQELVLELNLELCKRIASGDADAEPMRAQVVAYLRESVAAKLAVDNPKVGTDR